MGTVFILSLKGKHPLTPVMKILVAVILFATLTCGFTEAKSINDSPQYYEPTFGYFLHHADRRSAEAMAENSPELEIKSRSKFGYYPLYNYFGYGLNARYYGGDAGHGYYRL